MGNALQDQLLKAGLINEKQVKNAKKDKYKKEKVQRKSKNKQEDESKRLARQAQEEQAKRDKELNKQRDAELERKAVIAQIKQLIEMNRLSRESGDIAYNFTDGAFVKKIYVTSTIQAHLSKGLLAIVKFNEQYDVVPTAVANKISQRDESYIITQNEVASDIQDEDDPYADFQIPDDLMW